MPSGFYQSRHKLAIELLDAGVVTIAPPEFEVDTEKVTPDILATAARCMGHIQLAKKLPLDAVLGVSKTGEPFAEALAHCIARKRVELRIQQRGRRCIAALNHYGPDKVQRVMVVDGQARTGTLLVQTVRELREAGLTVEHVFTLFDWEHGVRDILARMEIALYPVFTKDEIFDIYVKEGYLTPYARATIGWKMAFIA